MPRKIYVSIMAKGKPIKPAPKAQPSKARTSAAPHATKQMASPAITSALPGGWLVGAVAALLGMLLYANTAGHDFCLDDFSAIKDNWVTKGGLKNLGIMFTTEYRYGVWSSPGPLYRPLILAMFGLEWQISPDNPGIHHIINIILYGVSGWVMWITWRRVLAGYPPVLAALAVLLFIAHPVHTEVVANIKSRDEIMSLLMSHLALYAVWRHFERGSSGWLWAAALFYGVGMFCKEGGITFLAVFFFAIWFFTDKGWGTAARITGLMSIPAFLFVLVYMKVIGSQNGAYDNSILDNFIAGSKTRAERLASAFMMCGRYLWTLICPHPLVSDLGYQQYKPVGWGDWRALLGFFSYAGMGVWALMNIKRKHFLAFAILFYLAAFSIVSNILLEIGTSYGERLLYVPSLGFALALAWALVKVFRLDDPENVWNPNGKGVLVWGVAGLLMLLYGAKTIHRNGAWFDSYSLYMADIGNSPNCAKLHYHLGLEEAGKGTDKETSAVKDSAWLRTAIGTYSRAIELYPDYHDAYGSRGLAHFRIGEIDQAFRDYQSALKYRPNDARVLSNLGFIYFMRSQLDSAESVYRRSVQFDPRFVDARRNLGAVLAMKRQFPPAIEQWKAALEFSPNDATLLFYIGSAYKDMGNMNEAQPWLEKAYKENPALRK